MKIIVLFALLLHFTSFSFGQTKIEKYCFLVTKSRLRSLDSKATLSINYGNGDSLFSFKDSSVLINLKKVASIESIPEAFNYLGSQGWTYIAFPIKIQNVGNESEEVFCFKRIFDKSELK